MPAIEASNLLNYFKNPLRTATVELSWSLMGSSSRRWLQAMLARVRIVTRRLPSEP